MSDSHDSRSSVKNIISIIFIPYRGIRQRNAVEYYLQFEILNPMFSAVSSSLIYCCDASQSTGC